MVDAAVPESSEAVPALRDPRMRLRAYAFSGTGMPSKAKTSLG